MSSKSVKLLKFAAALSCCSVLILSVCLPLECLGSVANGEKPPGVLEKPVDSRRGTRRVLPTSTTGQGAPAMLLTRSIFVVDKNEPSKANASETITEAPFYRAQSGKQTVESIADKLNRFGQRPAQLQASALFDEDPVRSPDRAGSPLNESLLHSITEQTNSLGNKLSDAEKDALPTQELDQSFLSLFHELWQIKNTSVGALVRLNYFTKNTENDRNWTIGRPIERRPAGASGCVQSGGGLTICPKSPLQPIARPTNSLQNKVDLIRGAQQILAGKQEQVARQQNMAAHKLSQAASRVNGWLSAAQQRLTSVKERLKTALVSRVRGPSADHRTGQPESSSTGAELRIEPDNKLALEQAGEQRRRRRRSANLEQDSQNDESQDSDDRLPADQDQSVASDCNKLTLDEEGKCRNMESMINVNLNYSFPGTTKAIEENCRHIGFLLTNCWTQQLAQLRMSLSSRNESLLTLAEFASVGGATSPATMATTTTATIGSEGSALVNGCGLEPSSPQYIRDRVSWMWLNLCIDKRFRQGYVHNLRCLATWNQPRAQRVCGQEYTRMQNYLVKQASGGQAALGLNYDWTSKSGGSITGSNLEENRMSGSGTPLSSSPQGSDVGQAANRAAAESPVISGAAGVSSSQLVAATTRGLSESELVDREVSSKMLCCMFDQFLRCVHKQAFRDCGRSGAQFVIDFMSRIGTDDMKYLCNADSKVSPTITGAVTVANHPNSRQPLRPAPQQANNQPVRRPGGPSETNRNPFIDNNYCIDPRIQSALASFGGGGATNSGDPANVPNSRTNPGSRTKLRPVSYDPAYFETFNSSGAKTFHGYSISHYYLFMLATMMSSWLLTFWMPDCMVTR